MVFFKKAVVWAFMLSLLIAITIFMWEKPFKEPENLKKEENIEENISVHKEEAKFFPSERDWEIEEVALIKKELTARQIAKKDVKIYELEGILKNLDLEDRKKVESILNKLGDDKIKEISEIIEKEMDEKGKGKILAILSEKLGHDEIEYILKLAKKYFAVK
ncbi:hypothetical protein [Caldanaerobacter sp.]|uniref:hypothetical protein n=1 Tax=Caldanaerobacter sp. TaxID=2930036 RepID=UPI003C78A113